MLTEIQTALFEAIKKGNESEVEVLLSKESTFSLEILERFSDIKYDFIKLSIPNSAIFKKIWVKYKDQVNPDRKANIFLYIVQQDNIEALKIILENSTIEKMVMLDFPYRAITILNCIKEKKENSQSDDAQSTYKLTLDKLLKIPAIALLDAVEKNNGMAVWLLLQVGNISHTILTVLLERAICRGFISVVKSLLHHCNKFPNNDFKKKILHVMCEHGNHEIWNILLKNKPIVDMLAILNADGNNIIRQIRANKESAITAEAKLDYQAILDECLQIPGIALFEAMEKNNEAEVKSILLKKNDIDDNLKIKILQESAQRGFSSVVNILFKKYDTANINRREIIMISLRGGHVGVLNVCLQQADFRAELMHYLASFGVDFLDVIQEKKENAISKEEECRYQAVIDRLLEIPGAAFLNAVARNNKAETLSLLMQKRINSSFQESALLGAARKGFHSILQILLNQNDCAIRREFKFIALYISCCMGHLDAANVLLNDSFFGELNDHALYRLYSAVQDQANNPENGYDLQEKCQNILDRLLGIGSIYQIVQNFENVSYIVNNSESAMAAKTKAEQSLIEHLKKQYETDFNNTTWAVIRREILSYLEAEYQKSPAIDGYRYVWMLKDNERIPVTFIPADTIGLHPQGKTSTLYWKDIDGILNKKEVQTIDVLSCYQGKENWLYQNTQDIDLVKTVLKNFDVPPHPYQNRHCPWEYNENYTNPSALAAYYRHPVHNAGRYFSEHNPWMKENAPFTYTSPNGNRRAIFNKAARTLISYIWIALNDTNVSLEPGFTIEGNKRLFAAVIAEANRGHNTDERPLYIEDQVAYNSIVQQHLDSHVISQLAKISELEMTSSDNMDEDLPTCNEGVVKRLLQCFYGHPYINASEAQSLTLHHLLRRMEDHLIKPKEQISRFDNFADRIKNIVDKQILFYILQQINDICDLGIFDGFDKIMLSEDDFYKYESLVKIPEKQLQFFLKQTKLWFTDERIEEKQAFPLTLDRVSKNVFLRKEHDSYQDFIVSCANNVLEAFSEKIYQIINKRLHELSINDEFSDNNAQSILYNYHNRNENRKAEQPLCTNSQLEDKLSKLDLRR